MDQTNVTRLMIDAASALDHDGHPFGLPPGPQEDCYRLRVDHEGAATLERLEPGCEPLETAHCLPHEWRKVAAIVGRDFNSRLEAKGMPAGRWPEPRGQVLLHRQFGRELEIAMLGSSDSYQMLASNLERWVSIGSGGRLQVYKLVTGSPLGAKHLVETATLELRRAAKAYADDRRAWAASGDVREAA